MHLGLNTARHKPWTNFGSQIRTKRATTFLISEGALLSEEELGIGHRRVAAGPVVVLEVAAEDVVVGKGSVDPRTLVAVAA